MFDRLTGYFLPDDKAPRKPSPSKVFEITNGALQRATTETLRTYNLDETGPLTTFFKNLGYETLVARRYATNLLKNRVAKKDGQATLLYPWVKAMTEILDCPDIPGVSRRELDTDIADIVTIPDDDARILRSAQIQTLSEIFKRYIAIGTDPLEAATWIRKIRQGPLSVKTTTGEIPILGWSKIMSHARNKLDQQLPSQPLVLLRNLITPHYCFAQPPRDFAKTRVRKRSQATAPPAIEEPSNTAPYANEKHPPLYKELLKIIMQEEIVSKREEQRLGQDLRNARRARMAALVETPQGLSALIDLYKELSAPKAKIQTVLLQGTESKRFRQERHTEHGQKRQYKDLTLIQKEAAEIVSFGQSCMIDPDPLSLACLCDAMETMTFRDDIIEDVAREVADTLPAAESQRQAQACKAVNEAQKNLRDAYIWIIPAVIAQEYPFLTGCLDSFNDGYIALADAIETWGINGKRFTTSAWAEVREAIKKDSLRRRTQLSQGEKAHDLAGRAERLQNTNFVQYGDTIPQNQLAAKLGCNELQLARAQNTTACKTLDAPLDGDPDNDTVGSMCQGARQPNRREISDTLEIWLDEIDPNDAIIARALFGMDDKPVSKSSLAACMKVDERTVSEIEEEILNQLRKVARKDRWRMALLCGMDNRSDVDTHRNRLPSRQQDGLHL